MRKINENQKITLTIGQLKKLVKESRLVKEYDQSKAIESMRNLCLDGIESIEDGIGWWTDNDDTEEIEKMVDVLKAKILDFFDSIPRDIDI